MALRQLLCMREISNNLGTKSPFLIQEYIANNLNLKYLLRPSYNIQQFRNIGKLRSATKVKVRKSAFGPQRKFTPSPFEAAKVDTGAVDPSRLWKPFWFTLAFSSGTFVSVTIWEYESLRSKAIKAFKNAPSVHWFKNKIKQQHRLSELTRDVSSWWNRLTPAEKVFIPLCSLNVLVFAMWRVPKFQPLMIKYFCSNPAASAVCWPMILSTFSHYSMFHIFANMYVLHSFTSAAVAALGKEQFLGLYLSAGVLSTFASYMYKSMASQAGLSLGASGAIMAILAFVCAYYPDTQLSIIFLPMYQFSAGAAIKVIMGIDLAGVILGWRFFDHAAHLGGALCGLFWCYYGSQYIWPQREYVLRYWHQLRTAANK